jgi:hypothetical protein
LKQTAALYVERFDRPHIQRLLNRCWPSNLPVQPGPYETATASSPTAGTCPPFDHAQPSGSRCDRETSVAAHESSTPRSSDPLTGGRGLPPGASRCEEAGPSSLSFSTLGMKAGDGSTCPVDLLYAVRRAGEPSGRDLHSLPKKRATWRALTGWTSCLVADSVAGPPGN